MIAPRAAFLVARASFTVDGWGGRPAVMDDVHYQGLEETGNGPVRVPEALFFDRAVAEAERARRESSARELLNPFWLGPLRELSSRTESDVREQIRALGSVQPPGAPGPPNYRDAVEWAEWWDRESANWTAEQRIALWKLFDKVRLFEIVEIEAE